MKVVAVILAGGQARRMGGGDKPLLRLGRATLLERIASVLRGEIADIAISANGDPARFAGLGLPVLPDAAFAGQGPLAGVLAGLDWAAALGAEALLTVPGDTPFLPSGLARALSPPPCCAASAGRRHHLVALWPVAARDRLRDWLAGPGSRAVGGFAETLGMRAVDFAAVPWDPFMNVNTPAELDAARAIAERQPMNEQRTLTVGIGGLGAIGLPLARALDAGVEGLRLIAVSARDQASARDRVAGFRAPPAVVPLGELAQADVVVEAAPAAVFEQIAVPAIEAGRILVAASAGALLPRMRLVERARQTGARIVIPTGALLGLDAVRAAAEGRVESVTIESRKPPRGLAGAPYLVQHGIEVERLESARCVFEGNAFDAAAGFPANVNVAAALALAGIGPERTRVQIWADPAVTRNTHTIRVEAEAARFTMTIEGVPTEANPRTGKLTPLSMLACLRGLTSTLKVGS